MKVEIIKDSINSKTDDRLTTFVLTFPRFINAEILRHRMLSFNSASSRAIPTKKILEDIENNPAMPVFWGKNQSGMQAVEELSPFVTGYEGVATIPDISPRGQAKRIWLETRDSAVKYVEQLLDLDLHKQITNRILEPFQNITLIVSGTEWENFFKLRASEFAQPEFKVLAEIMLEEYNKSIPEIKKPINVYAPCLSMCVDCADWHIPYEDKMSDSLSKHEQLKIAIARCARVSYLTQDGKIDKDKDFELYERLTSSGHFSPTEHIAFPVMESKFFGNFKGWFQFRKLLHNENARDSRVIKRKVVEGKVI